MKLRLRENSVRLRLLRSEVEKLRETGKVSETITFALTQKLIYTIAATDNLRQIAARFAANEIVVEIPVETAREWTETNVVGIEFEQAIENEKTLKVLIEKDFVCLDRPDDADNRDAFPHPQIDKEIKCLDENFQ